MGAGHLRQHRRRRELRLRRLDQLPRLRVLHDRVPPRPGARQAHRPDRMRRSRSGSRTARPAPAELDLVPGGRRPRRRVRQALERARHGSRVGAGAHATARARSRLGHAPGQQPAPAWARSQAGRAGPRGERGQGAGADRAPAALRPCEPASRLEAAAAHACRRHRGASWWHLHSRSSRGSSGTRRTTARRSRARRGSPRSRCTCRASTRAGVSPSRHAPRTRARRPRRRKRSGRGSSPCRDRSPSSRPGARPTVSTSIRRRASSRRRVREARSCGRRPGSWSRRSSQQKLVYSARFSPDGRFLVTAGADGALRLWRVGDWRELPSRARIRPHLLARAAFSADGRFLVAGGHPGWNSGHPGGTTGCGDSGTAESDGGSPRATASQAGSTPTGQPESSTRAPKPGPAGSRARRRTRSARAPTAGCSSSRRQTGPRKCSGRLHSVC